MHFALIFWQAGNQEGDVMVLCSSVIQMVLTALTILIILFAEPV